MKQTTTTRAMINAAINALCAGANDRVKFAPVEKGYQFDRVIVAVYHKGARKPFNTALVMVDTFRGIVHTADMIAVAPECMDAYRDIKAVKITAADVAEFVEPAVEQEQEAPAETEQPTENTEPATVAAKTADTMTEIESAIDAIRTADEEIKKLDNPEHLQAKVDAINWTIPRVNWMERINAAMDATQGAGTPRTTAR